MSVCVGMRESKRRGECGQEGVWVCRCEGVKPVFLACPALFLRLHQLAPYYLLMR